ncbi:hypothetical protein J6590_075332 [Homalodisca vitripennis]|nr:hypothetical protein J6590_075332 [Homalodisca vitripennis]
MLDLRGPGATTKLEDVSDKYANMACGQSSNPGDGPVGHTTGPSCPFVNGRVDDLTLTHSRQNINIS